MILVLESVGVRLNGPVNIHSDIKSVLTSAANLGNSLKQDPIWVANTKVGSLNAACFSGV